MATTLIERKLPARFFFGSALAAFFWFASWTHWGALGEHAFFPQWFGYILAVDALVVWRRGTSLLTRAPREFAALFALSAPIWWLFEGLNNFVLNWHYLIPEAYSVLQIVVEATINFGTVIPAVFETTELVLTLPFLERLPPRPLPCAPPLSGEGWVERSRALWLTMYAGVAGFAAIVFVPQFAFPLTLVWLFLILDPLNHLRGRASLIAQATRGDWRMPLALALAVLVCALFWEMWNFYAFPKWFYTVPFFGFGKIFEMPAMGYLGYIPFAWELYALYHFAWGVLRRPAIALA